MAKKRKTDFIKATRSDIIGATGFLLLALLILSAGLYSFAPFEKSELKRYETTVSNVEIHSTHRNSWVSFTDDNGGHYYFRTHGNDINRFDLKDSLTQDYNNKKLIIYYTNKI